MVEKGEEAVLAEIRTLLALERNYLAEERTTLSELQTGIALTLIGPSASAAVAYVLSHLVGDMPFFIDLIIFAFSLFLGIIGLWICLRSWSELKKIRKKKRILKDQEATIIKNSKVARDLMHNYLDLQGE